MPYDPEKLSAAVTRVRKRLKAQGVSRVKWASRAGLTEGAIRAMERGQIKSMRLETLYQLADAAEVPLWELLGEDVYWRDEYLKLRSVLEATQQEADRQATLLRDLLGPQKPRRDGE